MRFSCRKQQGFTLIELLVVISIIAVLSSIVLASVNSARKRAMYTKGMAEVKEMAKALIVYESVNDKWPDFPGSTPNDRNAYHPTTLNNNWTTLGTMLKPYLPQLPELNSAFIAFTYWTNNDPSRPHYLPIQNGSTYIYCLVIRDGFILSFYTDVQNSYSLNDGGGDPDGIDIIYGDYAKDTSYADGDACKNKNNTP